MIPKIIHYCWFGGCELPRSALKCIESWKKQCPDYKIIRWDESNFDVHANRYISEAYTTKKWAFVSDVARLIILYEYGGVYLDTDVKLIKSLDELLCNRCFMGIESTGSINSGLGCGAEPHMPIIKELLNDYQDREFDCNNPVCCPVLTTNVMTKYGFDKSLCLPTTIQDMTIYPIDYFAPIDLTTRKLHITEHTYSIHLYNASWQSEEKKRDTRFRKMCCFLFGNRLGLKAYGHLNAIKNEGIINYIVRHIKRK